MKLINKETIKGTSRSIKGLTLASIILTGAIALSATGCDAQIKADGITIDNLTITGSDAEGILESLDVQINGQNADLTDVTIPSKINKEANPSDNGNTVSTPSGIDNKVNETSGNKAGDNISKTSENLTDDVNDKSSDDVADQPSFDETQNTEAPAKGGNLYEAFLNGNATAGQYWFGEYYDDGLSISDLIERAAQNETVTEIDRTNCISYRYIDCGVDGIPELLLTVDYYCGWHDQQTYYVIKDIGGKLFITSVNDSWYRHLVEIKDNGEVTISYSNGANNHEYIKGFFNANGVYTKLYACNIQDLNSDLGFYTYNDITNPMCQIEFYTDGLEVPYKDWAIIQIDFGVGTSPVYTYSIWDENGNDITTEANFEDTDRIVKIMNYYGLEVFPHCEIEEMVFAAEEQLGVLNVVSFDIDSILYKKY